MVIADLVLILGWAIVLGAVVGVLPGLSPLLGLMLTLPLISWAPVWAILIFWTCYLTVTQYYGSVGAILFKVPGETSSIPALDASRSIIGTRGVVRSLRVTAFSSLVAGMIGIAGFAILTLCLKNSWNILFKTSVSVGFLTLLTVLILSRQGAWLRNTILVFIGVSLANLGDMPIFNHLCGQAGWTCFTLKPTDVGLAIVCLYALPYLFVATDHFDSRQDQSSVNMGWKSTRCFWPVAVRHGLLGWIMGFIPGLGVTLSSNTSAALESGNRPRRLRIMSAAESANNSSIISCTVPFLFMGLPITSTELLMDNWLLVNKAVSVDARIIYDTVVVQGLGAWPMWIIMLACLTLISVVCFFLTSRFVNLYLMVNRIPSKWFGCIIKFLIIVFTWLLIKDSDITAGGTVFTLVFFTALGVWAQKYKHDVVALPISLMIGSFAIEKFLIAYQLWS